MGGKKEYELTLETGHKSNPLHQKQANGYTHKWTVYVRGYNNARIEHCIQRVVFQLHESFDNPYRDIAQPPYKVKETGYAGFEIPIEIYFKNKDKHNNHCVVVHDLCLLTNKEHNFSKPFPIKFINPDRDFEKCLIKAGAQLLTNNVKKEKIKSPPPPQPPPPLPPAKKKKRESPPVDVKKERHEPPPPSNKKQKSSSSLIPSKDMGRQPTPQSQNQLSQSVNHHNHHHHSSNNNNNNNHHNHHHNHHNHHSNHHSHNQNHTTSNKVKPSKEFIDVFGAPLVYSQGAINSSNTSTISTSNTANSIAPIANTIVPTINANTTNSTPSSSSSTTTTTATSANSSHHKPTINSSHRNGSSSSGTNNIKQIKDELHLIQSKISCLSDCDRLQKIVDIVEEAGEWYNLTPKKFEFDLKRLDRKTLSKIERCLQH